MRTPIRLTALLAAAALAGAPAAHAQSGHDHAAMSGMPGMSAEDHAAMSHDSMPGMSAEEHARMAGPPAGRPVALVLGGFVLVNGAVLAYAAAARRRPESVKRRATLARVAGRGTP